MPERIHPDLHAVRLGYSKPLEDKAMDRLLNRLLNDISRLDAIRRCPTCGTEINDEPFRCQEPEDFQEDWEGGTR